MLKKFHVYIILKMHQTYDREILHGIASYVRENQNWEVSIKDGCLGELLVRENSNRGIIINFDIPGSRKFCEDFNDCIVGVGGGGGEYDSNSGVYYVSSDSKKIGVLAAENLIGKGLKNFAYCGYEPSFTNRWVKERGDAFCEEIHKAGFTCSTHFSGTDFNKFSNLHNLKEWLFLQQLPLGIFICNDDYSQALLAACQSLTLRVPEDVAIIGVGNDIICEFTNPQLSSIEQGCRQIGRQAAHTLQLLMDKNPPSIYHQNIPPSGITSRQSSDLIYIHDEIVSSALRLIRNGIAKGIQVANLMDALNVSRSTIDSRFRKAIGRSADEEIRRCRLETAKLLLAQTSIRLHDVALRSGYSTEQYLSLVFQKNLGCTPKQYRTMQQQRISGKMI